MAPLIPTYRQYRRTDINEAIDAFLKAVELDDSYYPTLRNLALTLWRQKPLGEAREIALRMDAKLYQNEISFLLSLDLSGLGMEDVSHIFGGVKRTSLTGHYKYEQFDSLTASTVRTLIKPGSRSTSSAL